MNTNANLLDQLKSCYQEFESAYADLTTKSESVDLAIAECRRQGISYQRMAETCHVSDTAIRGRLIRAIARGTVTPELAKSTAAD